MSVSLEPAPAPISLANGNGIAHASEAHAAPAGDPAGPAPLSLEEIIAAEQSISEEELFRHTETLASDEFGGRFPCTDDETRTLAYLQAEALKIGLTPGNAKTGTFTQSVPLVKITPAAVEGAAFTSPGGPAVALRSVADLMVWTSLLKQQIYVEASDIVFIGYGIKAQQWEWNDYSHLDVQGKTVVVLVNDPGFATNDPDLFNGRAMTYYGRWTYKFEEAGRHGAAACLIVHNTAAASYPWHVIENGRGNIDRPYYLLETTHKHIALAEGWITEDVARALFQRAGRNFDEEKVKASKRNFKAFPLGDQKFSVTLKQSFVQLTSHNFVAKIEGSDPVLRSEIIVFTAHWDHLGRKGNGIYHGARDNALGCAALLEIARAFGKVPTAKRRRSILFLFTTCEEQILLGSLHYVAAPLYPLKNTVACLNVDVMNAWGRTKDMSYSGKGFTDIDELIVKAAGRQDRKVTGEHTPETGTFYRSDHFPFAKHGVPAIYLKNGFEHLAKGKAWFDGIYNDWISECYHKPEDTVVRDPTSRFCWDLSGCAEDSKLLFDVACQLVDNGRAVHWKDGAEFKHVRLAHLKECIHV